MEKQFNAENFPIAKIGSSIGFTVGLIFAFKDKTGFWKGFGYTILGSLALGGIGTGIDYAINKNKNKTNAPDITADEFTGDVTFR